jgi:hypothetical protein
MAQLQVDHKCARETVPASSRNQQPQKELRFKAFGKLSHLWFVCCNCYTLWLLWALKMKQRNKETNRYIEKHQKISKNKVFCNHVLRIFFTHWHQMGSDAVRFLQGYNFWVLHGWIGSESYLSLLSDSYDSSGGSSPLWQTNKQEYAVTIPCWCLLCKTMCPH